MKQKEFRKSLIQVIIPILAVFFIIPPEMFAREPTPIVVEKTDGTRVQGTLLSVDVVERSLVVEKENTGVKISMKEIDLIRYKKVKFIGRALGKGFLFGAGVGLVGTGGILIAHSDRENYLWPIGLAYGTLFCALVGSLVGLITGVSNSSSRTVFIKGESDEQIEIILRKLKKLAVI